MALALTAGYGVLHWIHPTQGYWILLTTVFVCQPNYGATRLRLVQRILGTVVGLVIGWALIDLFPSPLVQSLFAVAAGSVTVSWRPWIPRNGVVPNGSASYSSLAQGASPTTAARSWSSAARSSSTTPLT